MQNPINDITGKPYEPPRREYGKPFHRPIVERVLREAEHLGRWLSANEISNWPSLTDDERARLNVGAGLEQTVALGRADKRIRDGDSFRRLEYHVAIA